MPRVCRGIGLIAARGSMIRRLCRVFVVATLTAAGNWGFAQPADEQAQAAEQAGQAAELPVKPVEDAAAREPEFQTHKWEFGISVRAIAGSCSEVHGTFPVPADWPEQQAK